MLNTSGLFGFFYIDVGKKLTFVTHKKSTDTDEVFTIIESQTLEQYLARFKADAGPLNWNKRHIFRNDKYLLLAIAAKHLTEESPESSLMTKVHELIEAKGLPQDLAENADLKDIVEKLERTYCLDFNPTCSVIGAIVAQEITKVITQRDFPSHGLAVYDSISQKCLFEK